MYYLETWVVMDRIMWEMYLMNWVITEIIYGRRVECNRVVGSMSYLETSYLQI